MEEVDAYIRQPARTELPPRGKGAHAPTRRTAAATVEGSTDTAEAPQPPTPTRMRFGTPEPPTIPIKSGGGTTLDNTITEEQQNRFAPLRQQGSGSGDRGSLDLSSGILRGGTSSASSSSKGSRGREPIPLTPEILLQLDRLEPDKGKKARILTEHLTRQRTLPCTEQELQKPMERKAEREIKRQQTASEAAANRAANEQMEARETAMAAHLAQQAMAAALAKEATHDEAIAAGGRRWRQPPEQAV